ncbi:ABC transporter permease subunit [Tomitella fengzijianii]|uniref:ABC transporter permease n=1 Tax=Tomitella fengzijianii TaxID=2597660 RepID=A0A516X6G5_9ACTN|nr:ABC transporter permease subunit [Tomitella fengzijianii]QDQ98664.1 ABC transporter permease [Tomitella fengzijianii]
MSTTAGTVGAAGAPAITIDGSAPTVPMSRLVRVEARKMFDTRSGFWLMASIGVLALVATIAVIAFIDADEINYGAFATAIGVPMAVLLPVMAILSVTSEWSQRTGLTTFTLVPDRGRVIGAKAITSVVVGAVSMLLALGIGALGNVIGSLIRGAGMTWDVSAVDVARIVIINVLGLMVGFMLGVLIRNSPAAIVGYFVYSFVVPGVFGALAGAQEWFADLQPWVDFNYSLNRMYESGPAGDWATLGVSGVIWLVIPLAIGVRAIMRSEVK